MAERGEPLSERELAVIEKLLDGSTNRQIAADLHISPNTVKVHLRNIFTKLGVASRTEATTVALQRGLIEVPSIEEQAHSDQAGQAPQPLEGLAEDNQSVLPSVTESGDVTSARRRRTTIIVTLAFLLLLAALAGA